MKPIIMAGTSIVIFALIFYSIGIYTERKSHKVTRKVLGFLTIGVVFDIAATICMIIGSENNWYSFHGILGFSSLGGMLLETTLAWRHNSQFGEKEVPKGLHLYSLLAYLWWVVAFISGGVLATLNRTS